MIAAAHHCKLNRGGSIGVAVLLFFGMSLLMEIYAALERLLYSFDVLPFPGFSISHQGPLGQRLSSLPLTQGYVYLAHLKP